MPEPEWWACPTLTTCSSAPVLFDRAIAASAAMAEYSVPSVASRILVGHSIICRTPFRMALPVPRYPYARRGYLARLSRGDPLRGGLRRALDRRQRSGDALQGLALGPHAEEQLGYGGEDHETRADEVRDEQARAVARLGQGPEDSRRRDPPEP